MREGDEDDEPVTALGRRHEQRLLCSAALPRRGWLGSDVTSGALWQWAATPSAVGANGLPVVGPWEPPRSAAVSSWNRPGCSPPAAAALPGLGPMAAPLRAGRASFGPLVATKGVSPLGAVRGPHAASATQVL